MPTSIKLVVETPVMAVIWDPDVYHGILGDTCRLSARS